MNPIARHENLTIREVAGETLVYDSQTNKAHCLNRVSALVWRHCDGQHSVADLAQLVRDHLHVSRPEAVVQLALEQLSKRKLLATPVAPVTGAARMSRREVLKKLAVTAAAIPLVMSLAAAEAVVSVAGCSKVPNGTPCGNASSVCCAGVCREKATFVTDNSNCGGCLNVCVAPRTCQNGTCLPPPAAAADPIT